MMKSTPPIVLALLIVFHLGCSADKAENRADPETPQQALEAIVSLYEKQDFGALIRTRYAEIAKADSEQKVQLLIDRHAEWFADPASLQQVISTYRSALTTAPSISPDGASATFTAPSGGTIRLSKMATGQWGFRL